MKLIKVIITSLVILLVVISVTFSIKSVYNKKHNIDDLIYNQNLYLFHIVENNATEEYISKIRYQIIRNIKPLVIVSTKYNPSLMSIYQLAQSFGININSLRSTNYIEAFGLLYPGKILLLHNKNGMLYKVKENNIDVFTIAKKFNVKIDELCMLNTIPPTYKFKKGEYVFLPNRYIKFKEFMLPLFNTKITSKFGLRQHPIFGILRFHEGIDLKQRYGAPVRAACDGKVIFAGWAEGYGKLVILKHHSGYTTYYGHLSKIKVKVGQQVYKGTIIGNVGTTGWTTGPHLHFEVRKNGVPVDPRKVLF